MAMQMCHRRVAQVTTHLVRQLARPAALTVDDGSIRHAHTDIQVPSFDYYRRKARLDPSKSYRDAGDATSPYSYLTPIGE